MSMLAARHLATIGQDGMSGQPAAVLAGAIE
jgi:hypothetical protein